MSNETAFKEHRFKDRHVDADGNPEPREWIIRIDAPAILAVRQQCDPNFMLGDTEENNTCKRLGADLVHLCLVVYCLCKDQADELHVTDKEFYEHLIGDTLQDAYDALSEAIVSFTPSSTMRELLRASSELDRATRSIGEKRALARISDPALTENAKAMVLEEVDAVCDRLLGSLLTQPSNATSTPDSSESGPRDAPSEN